MAKKDGGGKIFFNSIIYTISGLLLKCCGFFLLPLYTAYLTTSDYGISSIVTSFVGTANYVVSFSLYAATSRFYVEYKDDPQKLRRYYGTLVSFVFISGCVFGIVLFAGRSVLNKYVFSDIDFFPIVALTIIHLIFACEHGIYDSILRGQQRATKCSIITIISFFATLILNIIFVVFLKLGALGTVLSSLIVYVLYTLYFIVDMKVHNEIEFCIDKSLLKPSLKYSIPLIPHNLSANIAILISKVIIGNVGNLAAVGLYSIASQFGQMADVIQSYINQAYSPWLFEKLHAKDDSYKTNIRYTVNLLCAVIGLFLLCLSLFSQDAILLFLNKNYADAWRYVPLIVGVYAVKTIYYFYISILFYYKKASKLIFIATLTGSISNIAISAWIIPIWGVYGSIAADVLAMIIRVVIVVFISKRFEDIGLRVRDFIISTTRTLVFIFGGLYFSYTVVGNVVSVYNIIYKIAVVAMYIVLCGYPYRKTIFSYYRKFKNKLLKK